MFFLASAFFVASALTGCRGAKTEDEIVGSYEFKADWGCARLDLRPDHSFTQTVMMRCVEKDAQVLTGQWEALQLGTRSSSVRLSPYIRVTANGAGGSVGQDIAAIEKGPFSDLAISVSPDEGLEYVKTH